MDVEPKGPFLEIEEPVHGLPMTALYSGNASILIGTASLTSDRLVDLAVRTTFPILRS
jgi:hypothetical protein